MVNADSIAAVAAFGARVLLVAGAGTAPARSAFAATAVLPRLATFARGAATAALALLTLSAVLTPAASLATRHKGHCPPRAAQEATGACLRGETLARHKGGVEAWRRF